MADTEAPNNSEPDIKKATIIPLTAALFAPFGDVIEVSDAAQHYPINYGHSERFHDLAKIDTQHHDGRTALSIFRSNPLPLPIKIEIMERHPLSSQAFMPLSKHPYLVVVAPVGPLDESAIQVFLAQPHQGVNYHAGTWHHFSLALTETSDFLVIDRVGDLPNCDEVKLTTPLLLNPEPLL